ncbi:MAG: hypothetical protein WC291_03390, partial [Thermodesulfovibrionales bacterium]
MKSYVLILLIALSSLSFSCAPSKAYIDRTAEGRIIWPAPPEKPRIGYMWTVSSLSEGRMGFFNAVTGEGVEDISDPRSSGSLMRPYGLFADKGKLYIADTGAARVTVIDLPTSEVMNIWEAQDKGFSSPVSVVSD